MIYSYIYSFNAPYHCHILLLRSSKLSLVILPLGCTLFWLVRSFLVDAILSLFDVANQVQNDFSTV
jgi:hypothetical protein